jgi:hypothetical protein
MRSLAPATFIGVCLSVAVSSLFAADCIDSAATHHGVNSTVLRAIGWHESKLKSWAIGKNSNGTIDVGAFQINSIHFSRLASYGVTKEALLDGCVSAYVGAWHYKQQIAIFGNTWAAVGAYHSATPARQAWYANQIAGVLQSWGVIPQGPLPYVGVPTLAPFTAQRPAAPAAKNAARQHASATVFDGSDTARD